MDTMKVNPKHTTELANVTFPKTMVNGQTAGCMIGAGTSAAPVDCSTTASMKFNSIYTKSSATSGDSRNTYLRHYIAGAGASGEALRAFCTIDGVAAAGTANGVHASLSFANDGTQTGLGTAVRGTLHIPNSDTWTSGTLTALMAEIYSDGTASDPDGVTELSFIRIANNGASGKGDVDTDAFAFSFQGFTAGSGSMIYDHQGGAPGNTEGSIKIKIGSSTHYLMYYDAEAA